MEEKISIRNAKEARDISDRHTKGVSHYLEQVSLNVKYGVRRITTIDYMSDEVFLDLSKLGFKMSKKTGYIGEDITVIEW